MNPLFRFTILLVFLSSATAFSQEIPPDRILDLEELPAFLNREVIDQIGDGEPITKSVLAQWYRDRFAERFFYDWRTFEDRFTIYNDLYGNEGTHRERAEDHMGKYPDSTRWLLPFDYLTGEAVNSYALRHLARQHKMVDIALQYFYEKKDPKYIRYFTRQMRSLNVAFEKGEYERIEDGNGVFEVFRSGYRILNWLTIHNMFLGEEAYTDEDQLHTIATLLQHGAHLYERNGTFRSGNHQTRGMSALAMLSIIFRDFEGTDNWYELATKRLREHLEREINDDGFQFERSVHYHISDIGNFYYVFQLAKINGYKLDEFWEQRMRSLFNTLARIAYPDKSAPVLQDDTDDPWAEKNDISGAMTLGYSLFEDPSYGYFAREKVEDRMFWFLNSHQLELLDQVREKSFVPTLSGSCYFPETGYYIMREGWDPDDFMMIISAGLDDKKPDHQHGDMLGIQAMAYGNVILPNYQVRYSLEDYDHFKNSMVKNVALVDDELQGKDWRSNKGKSGFGKFGKLPQPQVINWQNDDNMDLFIGRHDGFEGSGVAYSRQVIYMKDDFWIVKDNFASTDLHTYKQVWQGHYTHENGPRLLRSSFENGAGCDIFQLNEVDEVVNSGRRGKHWSVISAPRQKNYSFITVIAPFNMFDKRIVEQADEMKIKNWRLNDPSLFVTGDQNASLSKDNMGLLFGANQFSYGESTFAFSIPVDLLILREDQSLQIRSLGTEEVTIQVEIVEKQNEETHLIEKSMRLKPGQMVSYQQ